MIDRRAADRLIVIAGTALLFLAFIKLLYDRGGPYLDRPATIVEHVTETKHEVRDALVLLPKVQPLLPRGVTVTCFRPVGGKYSYDVPNFHAAVGILRHQSVLPPFAAAEDIDKDHLVEYVVAVNDLFTHAGYQMVAEFPEGRLYRRR